MIRISSLFFRCVIDRKAVITSLNLLTCLFKITFGWRYAIRSGDVQLVSKFTQFMLRALIAARNGDLRQLTKSILKGLECGGICGDLVNARLDF